MLSTAAEMHRDEAEAAGCVARVVAHVDGWVLPGKDFAVYRIGECLGSCMHMQNQECNKRLVQ